MKFEIGSFEIRGMEFAGNNDSNDENQHVHNSHANGRWDGLVVSDMSVELTPEEFLTEIKINGEVSISVMSAISGLVEKFMIFKSQMEEKKNRIVVDPQK